MLETLPPDQCTRILSTTISDRLLLSFALEYNMIEISHYLYQLSLSQKRNERSDSWNKGVHPLINALSTDCFRIIFQISRNLRDINDYISASYTPLLYAVESSEVSYVRLILLLGGDINKPGLNGISPLIASISNSKMCSFLLSQNANGNHQDDEGNTALHQAAARMQSESAQILIKAEVDVRIRNKDGMTPLMSASVNINHQTVLDLCELSEYSQIEKIEALEVLGACSVGYQCPKISYWFQALEMRRNTRFHKILDVPAQKVLDFSREFTRKKELKSLQADQLKLAFQGILVIERIFGRNNSIYLRQLLQTTLIANDENKLEKFQQLIDYIVEYCQETPANIVVDCSHFFYDLFTEIFSDDNPGNIFENSTFDLFKILARATVETWHSVKDKFYGTPYNEHIQYSVLADTLLYITEIITSMNLPESHKGQLKEVVVQLVKDDPRFIHLHSLLHRAAGSTETEPWGSVELIRLLLESGADINSKDYFRRTPLMYALMYIPDDRIEEILEVFLEYNCHFDCRDYEGFSAMDFTRWASLSFASRSPRCLQCLAVEAILDNEIEYKDFLSEGLEVFVDLHR